MIRVALVYFSNMKAFNQPTPFCSLFETAIKAVWEIENIKNFDVNAYYSEVRTICFVIISIISIILFPNFILFLPSTTTRQGVFHKLRHRERTAKEVTLWFRPSRWKYQEVTSAEFRGDLSVRNACGNVPGMAISLRERSRRQETRGKFDHPDITPILRL